MKKQCIITGLLGFAFLFASSATAQVPERLQYQGYLQTVAGDPVECPTGLNLSLIHI